jgi:hypothetical protein
VGLLQAITSDNSDEQRKPQTDESVWGDDVCCRDYAALPSTCFGFAASFFARAIVSPATPATAFGSKS